MDPQIRNQHFPRGLLSQFSMDSRMWSDEETIALLDIWGSYDIQDKLNTMKRNRLVWEEVAKLMGHRGYRRSAKQCCGKIHNLKVEFRKVKTMKKQNNFKFYDMMDPIMANDETLAKVTQESSDDLNSMAGEDHTYGFSFDQVIDTNQVNAYQAVPYQQASFDQRETGNQILRSVKVEVEIPDTNEPTINNSPPNTHSQIQEPATQVATTAPLITTNTVDTPIDRPDHSYRQPINRPRKRRHQCQGIGLVNVDVVFEKLRQLQEESDKRFYAWEERRLRLEQEFEERRQRVEAEKEAHRERFVLQLVSMIGQHDKPRTVGQDYNRVTQPTVVGMPRIHTIISSNGIGIRRTRTGEIFAPASNRPAAGRL